MNTVSDKRSRHNRAFLAGTTPLLHETKIECPYCGEHYTTVVDGSAGDQEYFEDCEICCRPIVVRTHVDFEGNLLLLSVAREDD